MYIKKNIVPIILLITFIIIMIIIAFIIILIKKKKLNCSRFENNKEELNYEINNNF